MYRLYKHWYLKLRQAGLVVNHKRVGRLYALAKLQSARRRRCRNGDPRPCATSWVWSMDSVFNRTILTSAYERGVTLRPVESGKPNQNAYNESFNRHLRDECLNEHWFTNMTHAKVVI